MDDLINQSEREAYNKPAHDAGKRMHGRIGFGHSGQSQKTWTIINQSQRKAYTTSRCLARKCVKTHALRSGFGNSSQSQ